jgi:hypothetical protein
MLNYQMVIGKSSVFNRKLSPIQWNHLFLWVIFHSYVSLEESFGSAQKATKTTASFHSNFHPVLEIPRKVFPTSPDQTNVLNDWGPMVTTIPVEIHSCGTAGDRFQISGALFYHIYPVTSEFFSIFPGAPSQVTENSWTLWECPRNLYCI